MTPSLQIDNSAFDHSVVIKVTGNFNLGAYDFLCHLASERSASPPACYIFDWAAAGYLFHSGATALLTFAELSKRQGASMISVNCRPDTVNRLAETGVIGRFREILNSTPF